MKRFLSILVAVAMTISMVLPVFAYTDVADSDYAAAIAHLSGLGVVDGYEDGSYKPEKVVTRAEMAKLLVVALGLDAGADLLTGESEFADVATSHWAIGFINVATQYGLIKGDGDGNFRPDDTVNYAEVATMALRALNYTKVVEEKGQWPTNYLNKANELKLFEDVAEFKASEGAKRGEVAQILWNMVNSQMWAIVAESQGNGFISAPGDTMMTVKFPHYSLRKLNVMDELYSYNVEIIDEDTVKIDGIEYDGVNPIDLFDGEVFEAIVYEKDKVVKGMSLYINAYDEVKETTAVVGRFNKAEVNKVYINGEAYKYENEVTATADAAKTYTLARAGQIARIVLDKNNKVSQILFLNDLVNAEAGDAQFVVDTVKTDKDGNVTYKGYNDGESIEVENDDVAMYISLDEKADASFAKASDIKQGTVLAEIMSGKLVADGRLFVVMNEKVSGKLDKIEAGKLVVAGNSYSVPAGEGLLLKYASKDEPETTPYDLDAINEADLIGEVVTITLDANNVALYMEAEDKVVPANYGFITNVFTNTSGEEPVVRVKVVGLDGVATTYDAYDFEADEQVVASEIETYLTKPASVRVEGEGDEAEEIPVPEVIQLVKFELKNGKIDMSADKGIDTEDDLIVALGEVATDDVNETRKTIKVDTTEYVTTSATKFLNVGFDEDKFTINTVTFDDVKDELSGASLILAKATGVKVDYVVVDGEVETEENYAIVVSNGISIGADDKYYADIYDVTTGETITDVEVNVIGDYSAAVGNTKGAIVTYTKNGEGVYKFETPDEEAGIVALDANRKIFVEAGEGYTKINGANVIVKDDVIKVVYLDENLNIVDGKDMTDIEEGYKIYVAKEVSTTDDAAKIIIVIEK